MLLQPARDGSLNAGLEDRAIDFVGDIHVDPENLVGRNAAHARVVFGDPAGIGGLLVDDEQDVRARLREGGRGEGQHQAGEEQQTSCHREEYRHTPPFSVRRQSKVSQFSSPLPARSFAESTGSAVRGQAIARAGSFQSRERSHSGA